MKSKSRILQKKKKSLKDYWKIISEISEFIIIYTFFKSWNIILLFSILLYLNLEFMFHGSHFMIASLKLNAIAFNEIDFEIR